MAVNSQTPDGTAFDHHAGDNDGPTETAHNVAQRLADRDEVRRLTWMSYSGEIKAKTEDVESTLNALDFDRLTVEVEDTSPLDVTLRISW